MSLYHDINFVQDLNNVADYRPTLDELMLGQVVTREKVEEEVDTRKGKVIKFGWIEGVLMRLNISSPDQKHTLASVL